MNRLNFFFLLSCLIFITNCNFKPLYGSKANKICEDELRSIEIHPVNTIEGAEFINNLMNILPQTNPIRYVLKVDFKYKSSSVMISKNSDILRQALNQLVEYVLYEKLTNKILTQGRFSHMTTYNTFYSPYDIYIQNEYSNENLTRFSAEILRNKLILFFSKNH